MERITADLAALQSNIKRDPEGYVEEFEMQLRRYAACLDIFALQPTRPHRELADLVSFLAAVAPCYPSSKRARALPRDLAGLLSATSTTSTSASASSSSSFSSSAAAAAVAASASSMDPHLRLAIAKALMLLRNRGAVAAEELLPLWVSCLSLRDKALRRLLCSHVVADVKRSNAKRRDDRLNRAAQAALGACASGGDSAGAARASLGLLAELWRRRLWRDARTANAIAGACSHHDERVAVAALKFFLGEDAAEAAAGEESDSDDDGGGGGAAAAAAQAAVAVAGPGKGDIYRATQLGTASSKKKKKAKLKRAMASVKKAARREHSSAAEGFAALQLLHDPQTFAEHLFARIRGGGGQSKNSNVDVDDEFGGGSFNNPSSSPARPFSRHDARLAGARVLSRAIGTHRLLLLNFYPWCQRQLAPHHRDVSLLLSALVQASHDRVPPEALRPALRQLVDAFVHDRARPEVAVAGLKAVRELCARAPLVMDADLLSDLAAYRKARDKEVASAARALVSLFREINPALLAKRERGRGADLDAAPSAFGAAEVATRIPGAELLEAEEQARRRKRAGRGGGGSDDDDDDDDGESGSEGDWSDSDDDEDEDGEEGEEEEEEEEGSDVEGVSSEDDEDEEQVEDDDDEDDDAAPITPPPAKKRAVSSSAAAVSPSPAAAAAASSAPLKPAEDSLATLKRALAEAKAKKAEKEAEAAAEATAGGVGADGDGEGENATSPSSLPLEAGRILDDADFKRIRELRRERLVEGALAKHGLKSTSSSKRARAEAAAADDADAVLAAVAARSLAPERRVDPDSLLGRARGRRDKAARMASVLEGREGREFGSAAGRRKSKAGGLSNREKQKRKAMPLAARSAQARKRAGAGRSKRPGKAGKGNFKR